MAKLATTSENLFGSLIYKYCLRSHYLTQLMYAIKLFMIIINLLYNIIIYSSHLSGDIKKVILFLIFFNNISWWC